MDRMEDLVQFLRARLDEDAATARAVEDGSAPWDGQWTADGSDVLRTRNGHVLAYGHRTTDGRDLPVPLKPGLVAHIARHDPARVLADIDAKRRIVDECAYWLDKINTSATDKYPYPNLAERGEVVLPVITLLGLPYADHPDYQDAWRP